MKTRRRFIVELEANEQLSDSHDLARHIRTVILNHTPTNVSVRVVVLNDANEPLPPEEIKS